MKDAPTVTRTCTSGWARGHRARSALGRLAAVVVALAVVGILVGVGPVGGVQAAEKAAAEKPSAEPVAPAKAVADDGPVYVVEKFVLMYGREHPDHPPLDAFMDFGDFRVHTGSVPRAYDRRVFDKVIEPKDGGHFTLE